MATNTSSPQQEANFLEQDDDTGSDEEAENTMGLESDGQDTGIRQNTISSLRMS